MTGRRHSVSVYNAIKTAIKLVIADLGGLDAAATCTRVKRSQLGDYGSPGIESFMPADVIADLETVAGTPHVTAALARAQGFMLLPIEFSGDHSALSVLLATMGKDVGELFATAAAVLAHGTPTDAERETLLREFDEIRKVSMESIAFLKKATC
jgi:hypothetical protein